MPWSTSNEIWGKSICVWTTSWVFGFKPILGILFVNVGCNHVDIGVTAILETNIIIFLGYSTLLSNLGGEGLVQGTFEQCP